MLFRSQDIVGTVASGSTAAVAALDWYSTGTSGCFFFRMRIAASAITKSRINNNLWIVGLGTGSTTKAWMVVDGNNTDPNYVRIIDGANSANVLNSYAFNGYGSSGDYAWATNVGSYNYVYWQVPYSDLSTALGGDSVFGFFAGTSQSNSFTSINGDVLGSSLTPNYNLTQQTDLSQNLQTAASPTISSPLSVTSGTTAGSEPGIATR